MITKKTEYCRRIEIQNSHRVQFRKRIEITNVSEQYLKKGAKSEVEIELKTISPLD
jgi:hypothetical protein